MKTLENTGATSYKKVIAGAYRGNACLEITISYKGKETVLSHHVRLDGRLNTSKHLVHRSLKSLGA